MEKTYRILKMLIWILVFAVVIVGAYVLYNNLSGQVDLDSLVTEAAEETAATNAPRFAPDFTVYDAEGNSYKLSDFRGKPVLLNFWASWCGPCKMEMPDFEKAYQTYGEDIHFVIVNLTDGAQETVESASAFIAEQGYTFPVYYDTAIDAAMQYGVSAIPVSYFLDAEGCFVTWAQGALSADRLQKGIDLLLGTE